MKADYEKIKSTDVTSVVAALEKAEADWPAKKADLDARIESLKNAPEKAEKTWADVQAAKDFYDEYFAVLDLTEEFYLETVERVFQTHLLAKGQMTHHGRVVHPAAIRRTALLTVEGERDDICAAGQTVAAHDLAPRVPPAKRGHHLQAGVGHYGVFSGRRWENEIYPIVRRTILSSDRGVHDA